ncbi:hypothetical protein [Microcoleus sp. F4-D5]|uniref:hypothetical protein n=1 Tax=Microcoleus sp. F4-D5 TaxID=2818760 RepID=UPI002FD5B97C
MAVTKTKSQNYFSGISILLFIGAVIAVWMAAVTVPVLVCGGIKSLNPHYLIFLHLY